ncbi:MAG TPA: SDR family oxidoreductase [Miltoncostaeaceae bacterium]|nr:SDR family oxidoreductase [Miltoncostaeaceae bacterium]
MPGTLDGCRCIVTGASRGVGRAVAEAYAGGGARVVATATSADHLTSLRAAAGPDVTAVALDLRDAASVDRAAAEAVATLGRVDVLVNNAGLLGVRAPLADYPLEVWDEVLAAGLTGTLRLIQRVLPGMTDGGAIVNVTSGAAGRPTWGAYAVAKLGIDGMTRMLREELADRRIRVVAINPGPTRTAMRAAAYPREDPATVPHPASRVGPFLAVAAGADPGWLVQAAEWAGA